MIMKFELISLRKKRLKCNVKDYQYTEISVSPPITKTNHNLC